MQLHNAITTCNCNVTNSYACYCSDQQEDGTAILTITGVPNSVMWTAPDGGIEETPIVILYGTLDAPTLDLGPVTHSESYGDPSKLVSGGNFDPYLVPVRKPEPVYHFG